MPAEPGSDEPERRAKDQVVTPRHCEKERERGRGYDPETALRTARHCAPKARVTARARKGELHTSERWRWNNCHHHRHDGRVQ